MSAAAAGPDAAPGPKRRRGGCLSGLALLAGIGAIIVYGWFALTGPWIYTVGRTRLIPLWQGSAQVEGPGGQYRIYLEFWPTSGPSVRPSTWVTGYGWVCAPQGHATRIQVDGSTDSVVWKDMNGLPFHLYTEGPGTFAKLNRGQRGAPALELFGRWNGNRIEMRDARTIDAAYNPDGTLADPVHSGGTERTLVFGEEHWGFFFSPC